MVNLLHSLHSIVTVVNTYTIASVSTPLQDAPSEVEGSVLVLPQLAHISKLTTGFDVRVHNFWVDPVGCALIGTTLSEKCLNVCCECGCMCVCVCGVHKYSLTSWI